MKKLYHSILLLFFLLTCGIQSAMAASVSVILDGETISFPETPFIENGRVMVPMRGILESLGYTVEWQEEEQSVLATHNNISILLPLESTTAIINGEDMLIDVPARLYADRTFVPLRFLAEYSGAEVIWDAETYTILITSQTEILLPSDSVVMIQTDKMLGSGVILSEDGVIVTNFHVIEGASHGQIVFHNWDVYTDAITVIGLDPESDIALLKINKKNLTPAKPSTEYAVGDRVTAIGSPDGMLNTESFGTIQSFNQDLICTTAPIFKGSSGGGLFDASGNLIGITSAYADTNYFAIPISWVSAMEQNLSIPLSEMKQYVYQPSAPENLRYEKRNEFYYLSWSPIYKADYYYVSVSLNKNQSFQYLRNEQRNTEEWFWSYPDCLGITANHSFYVKVVAVVDGKETAASEPLKITP